MSKRLFTFSILMLITGSVAAQQPCPTLSVVVNTPEDQLMLAINGAEKPEDQIAALDKFSQEHADSKFIPCVNEYYTSIYVKMGNFDKAVEFGEKDLAANYQDTNLLINLAKAYVGGAKATDRAFEVILKSPDQFKAESNAGKPAGASDAEWQKTQAELAEALKDDRAYMEYAFFQLLPRVTDANKRIEFLDGFMKSYPDTPNAGQVNFQYFIAYKMANNTSKAGEYGEKAIASDPNSVAALNLVADDYATRRTNLDKASEYAKKVLQLVPAMKKPDGVSGDAFTADQNVQLGLAHITLGYIDFQRAAKTRKVAPAIQELTAAVSLLKDNAELQGKALFFLGNAYEFEYPPNHRSAIDALTKAASLPSGFQGQSRDLLAKVRQAAH